MQEDKKQDVTVDQSYSDVLKRLVTSKSREEKEKNEKRAEEENRRAEDERKKAEEKKNKAEEAQKKAENEKKSVKDKKAEEEDLKRKGVNKEGEKQGKWHETKTVEVGRLKEGTNMMNEILTSMNLPAGLEDTTGGGVPASLVEKCQAVVAAGGVS